ncbi:hypothetical protein VCRA2110O1_20228 [Vibrio crassostreae]|nr:hypothetical protein VCRA2110O4_120054 [Vibrio crassostreae]CAK1977178.1 hypothetical protein VCRA2110O1_20228 [Vibrio crassostreae]CAK2770407.1 hypothetical protein VCRA2110O3_20226 [Vibrio crassostreae]CAK2785666.1 hypothetical protein VCRA2110O2_20271 [Vibrio crassostreae]CAK2843593.1 hypothetical protein VCRA2122O10_20228 [Vibrio crassostreae]
MIQLQWYFINVEQRHCPDFRVRIGTKFSTIKKPSFYIRNKKGTPLKGVPLSFFYLYLLTK